MFSFALLFACSFVHDLAYYFAYRTVKTFEITFQQHTLPSSPASSYPMHFFLASRTQLATELRSLKPLSTSENRNHGLSPKIVGKRMLLKMRMECVHRQLAAMGAGPTNPEEEKDGPVGLGDSLGRYESTG